MFQFVFKCTFTIEFDYLERHAFNIMLKSKISTLSCNNNICFDYGMDSVMRECAPFAYRN